MWVVLGDLVDVAPCLCFGCRFQSGDRDSMSSLSRSRPPALLLLQLLLCSCRALAARSDRTVVPEEYVGATVNATVLDGRGNIVQVMSSDDGRYGQNSPRVDTRGVVITPAPRNGGTEPSTEERERV